MESGTRGKVSNNSQSIYLPPYIFIPDMQLLFLWHCCKFFYYYILRLCLANQQKATAAGGDGNLMNEYIVETLNQLTV